MRTQRLIAYAFVAGLGLLSAVTAQLTWPIRTAPYTARMVHDGRDLFSSSEFACRTCGRWSRTRPPPTRPGLSPTTARVTPPWTNEAFSSLRPLP
jgi:hypothetical protein